MAIENVIQPEIIQIDCKLRLRKFEDHYDFALSWYQDEEMVWLVDGDRIPYTFELLTKMYHYLNNAGELYFIEVLENNEYIPIGDVTFWKDDMPIVIGNPKYRRKGIGKKVIQALIKRAKELGYKEIFVDEIYEYNTGSKCAFESCGFKEYQKTSKGARYIYRMED